MRAAIRTMIRCLVFPPLFLGLAAPGKAQLYSTRQADNSNRTPNFCAGGKIYIFTGNCVAPETSKQQPSISESACSTTRSLLSAGLRRLYPHAAVLDLRNQNGRAVAGRLSQMDPDGVLGFFFIGEGDVKGGFVTGSRKDRVYPAPGLCANKYDLFGGFTSFSKFSAKVPAPPRLRGPVLPKMEMIYDPGSAVTDSWPKLCSPMISLVYQTRTSVIGMKEDAKKFIAKLDEKKQKQALKVLNNICQMCDYYVKNGQELARLCPPNSDVCQARSISPAGMKLIYDHYCTAIPYGMPAEESR